MILTADIGGTNARFALVDERGGKDARIVLQRNYQTAAFPSFAAALDAFIGELGTSRTTARRAVVAIAGPVDPEGGELTNHPAWGIGRRPLEERGFHARFINDFEALAYGVVHAGEEHCAILQQGDAVPRANIALVGAGTGLGVGALVWDGASYRASPSEGGHIGFAPQDAAQLELWRHLAERYGRVSAERVVSGPGLVEIYRWLSMQARSADEDDVDAAEITARSIAQPSSIAAQAVNTFVACYGAVAGDIALAFLARGGVYICGGIAAKLCERLAQPDFIAAFRDKGRHSGLMASIPVRVVLNENLGLIGAAYAPISGTERSGLRGEI